MNCSCKDATYKTTFAIAITRYAQKIFKMQDAPRPCLSADAFIPSRMDTTQRLVDTHNKKRRTKCAALLHINIYFSVNRHYLREPLRLDYRRVDDLHYCRHLDRQHFRRLDRHRFRQHPLVALRGTIRGAHRPQ